MLETLLKLEASAGLDKFPSIDAALKNHKHHAEERERDRERKREGGGRGEVMMMKGEYGSQDSGGSRDEGRGEERREGEREKESRRMGTGTETEGRTCFSAARYTLADVTRCDWPHCHISPGRAINRMFNSNSSLRILNSKEPMSWNVRHRGMFTAFLRGWGWMPPSSGASWARKAAGHFQGSVFGSW